MVSSKQVGTAAAAEQLGSMSLGGRGNDTEPAATAKNGTPTKLLCSACGEKSDTLKKCTACLCVWYCGKDCQNRHWKEHKKECKPIKKALAKRGGKLDLGNELDLGPLPDLPPREECPICMRVLPIHAKLQTYFPCCGKTVCGSCDLQHQVKSGERAAERGRTPVPGTCAFCRTAAPISDKDILTQLSKRVELKDPNALFSMAMKYGDGTHGLPVDEVKCIDLMRQAAALGFPSAQYQLGNFHHYGEMGLGQNEVKALKYWAKAAEGGDLTSLHNLGCIEADRGDLVAAMRHWRLSASGGYKRSMGALIAWFEDGLLHHGDLAETLQVFYFARAEMRSDDRDSYIEYLKMTGVYKVEYEC